MPFPSVVDSSILADFKACPALCKLSHFDDWKPRMPSTHLHAGGAFAHGLEATRRAFYENLQHVLKPDAYGNQVETGEWEQIPLGYQQRAGSTIDPDHCIGLGVESLLRFYGDHQPPSHGTAANKTALRMAGALEFYFSRYPLNHQTAYPILMPGKKLGIEFSFVHPIPIANPDTGEQLQYSGRADGIFAFAGGNYIFDDKTASSLGPTWAKQWKLRSQFSGYCWAAQQAGLKVDGVVVRGVSILKERYDTMEDISFRSEYMISTWYTEMLDWVDQMIYAYKNNKWSHNFDHACSDFGGCGFQDICDSEDPIPWLERSHERRHWDPVTRKETKL